MAETTTEDALRTAVRDGVLPNPTGFIGWYNALLAAGLGTERVSEMATYICDAVVAEHARAERLAGLLNDVAYSWDPAMFVVVCRFCGGASPGGTTKPGHAPECALARAALAGDAPGRGEASGG